MRVQFSVQLLSIWALLAASADARSGGQVSLQDEKVDCEPTKCLALCPIGSGGYHYYFDITDGCLRCRCRSPKGLDDCGEDSNPSLCDSVAIPEDCKNMTIIQSCIFSCSPSGQLWWAASKVNLDGVNTAIAAGANPTCQRNYTQEDDFFDHVHTNMTALHLAAIGLCKPLEVSLSDQLSVFKALINANANLDVAGGLNNATALYWAAYCNNPEISLLLIEHNADVNIAANNGETPLIWAAQWGQLDVAKALLNANASLDVTAGWDNATALYYAIRDKHPYIALLLIEHNADVSIPAYGFQKKTPLMWAAMYGQLSVVKALINANASLDVTGGGVNATALHGAIYHSHEDIVILLIEHNADVNIPAYYNFDETPLILAARRGQLGIAKALINANASLDVTGGWYNVTALHYAARYDIRDVALLLLQSGADTMIPNKYGATAKEMAILLKHYHLADIIESYAG